MKIYTKTGDGGKTSLASGRRVDKNDGLIEAYGTVDELNAFVGLLRAKSTWEDINSELKYIQHCLFNVGALLARDGLKMKDYPELTSENVEFLEKSIDSHNSKLQPLRNFILPGGSETIALSHVCRTITRRAERKVIRVDPAASNRALIIVFLNRLSDYFFILARSFAILDECEEERWNSNF